MTGEIADPVDALKAAFAMKEAERAAALIGEHDPARVAAVAAQLRLTVNEDRSISVAASDGKSAAELFSALGPPRPGFTGPGPENGVETDPDLWTFEQRREFVERHGMDAYKARFAAAVARKRSFTRP